MIKRPKTRAGVISARKTWRKNNPKKNYPKYLELKGNPVKSLSRSQKIKKAVGLYEDFRGKSPKYIDQRKFKIPDVALEIGKCDGILYTTQQDGRAVKYIHKFKRGSRPMLATSHDGSTLLLIGGSYAFTHRGIVDR